MVSVRVSSKLEELAEILFAKDRMAPEEDRFHSQNTRKCIFIGKKKATRVCLKVYRETHENT